MRYKIIKEPSVAPELSLEDAKHFGIDITKHKNKGVLKTTGGWQIPVSYKALAISKKYNRNSTNVFVEEMTVYGQRTLRNLKPNSYHQEGSISINSKRYSAFTSSQLFTIEGELIDVSVIHVRID